MDFTDVTVLILNFDKTGFYFAGFYYKYIVTVVQIFDIGLHFQSFDFIYYEHDYDMWTVLNILLSNNGSFLFF